MREIAARSSCELVFYRPPSRFLPGRILQNTGAPALTRRAHTRVHPAQTLGVRKLVSRNQIRQADFYPQARFMKATVHGSARHHRLRLAAWIQLKMAAAADVSGDSRPPRTLPDSPRLCVTAPSPFHAPRQATRIGAACRGPSCCGRTCAVGAGPLMARAPGALTTSNRGKFRCFRAARGEP